jgi:hypothetical protein
MVAKTYPPICSFWYLSLQQSPRVYVTCVVYVCVFVLYFAVVFTPRKQKKKRKVKGKKITNNVQPEKSRK